jgi:hypothetical protein
LFPQANEAVIEKLAGENMREATAYFVAAMASRAGETRKKIIHELMEPMKAFVTVSAGGNPPAYEAVMAVAAVVETVRSLLKPLPLWNKRKTFVLPFKDVLSTLLQLEVTQCVCVYW